MRWFVTLGIVLVASGMLVVWAAWTAWESQEKPVDAPPGRSAEPSVPEPATGQGPEPERREADAATSGPRAVEQEQPDTARDRLAMLPSDRTAELLYVALGDSTVVGVGASSPERSYPGRLHARLQTVYPRARLENLGVPGATAADVVRDQLPRAVALVPHLVTLSVGPNDITRGRPIEEYDRDVDTMFQALSGGATVIVVNLLPDLALAPLFGHQEKVAVGQRATAVNEVLIRRGRQYGVEVVDLYAPSRAEVPERPDFVSRDAYHPSDDGYARWADLMWRGVEARIPPRGAAP